MNELPARTPDKQQEIAQMLGLGFQIDNLLLSLDTRDALSADPALDRTIKDLLAEVSSLTLARVGQLKGPGF